MGLRDEAAQQLVVSVSTAPGRDGSVSQGAPQPGQPAAGSGGLLSNCPHLLQGPWQQQSGGRERRSAFRLAAVRVHGGMRERAEGNPSWFMGRPCARQQQPERAAAPLLAVMVRSVSSPCAPAVAASLGSGATAQSSSPVADSLLICSPGLLSSP